MSALDLVATARDMTFSARVAMISMKSAVAVGNEAPDEPDHQARLAWANKVLRGDQNNKILASAIIASNATITAAIEAAPDQRGGNVPDDHIEFSLNSMITALGRAELAVLAP